MTIAKAGASVCFEDAWRELAELCCAEADSARSKLASAPRRAASIAVTSNLHPHHGIESALCFIPASRKRVGQYARVPRAKAADAIRLRLSFSGMF
jgi:hypothetical protein